MPLAAAVRVSRELERFILKQNEIVLSSKCGADPTSPQPLMTGIVNTEEGQRVRYRLAKEHSGNKSSTLIWGCVCGETPPCNSSPGESEKLARLPWF